MSVFKAYDIRGLVPGELDEALLEQLGNVFAAWLAEQTPAAGAAASERLTIGVARDARTSSPAFARAFIEGATRAGADVVDFGRTTTPMLYFGIGSLALGGGAMITASHNPAGYNGVKFTRENAIPISEDTGIREFERRVTAGTKLDAPKPGTTTRHDLFDAYRTFVTGFARHIERRRYTVAIDPANGMAGLYAPIFADLKLDVVPRHFEINGTFPNHEANPLRPENLRDVAAAVRETGCDFGVAFDGDADRAVFVDHQGTAIPSDLTTALLATDVLAAQPGATIIYDLRSSHIVPETIEAHGGRALRVRVGHSFAKAIMRAEHAAFGGELSGHFYFAEAYQSDSAILALVAVLNALRRQPDVPLAERIAPLRKYHSTGEVNFVVDEPQRLMEALAAAHPEATIDWEDGVTVAYPDWWFNVRKSNTEPLLRLNLECTTAEALAARFVEIRRTLGEPRA